MGVVIFWVHYVVAFILLWHILRCIYIKGDKKVDYWDRYKYQKTDNDERLKHPIWIVALFMLILCIPILNLIVFVAYIMFRAFTDSGSDESNPYYIKSLFTKKV